MDQAITLLLNGSSSLYLDGIAWTATQTTTWLPLAIVLLYVVIQANDLRGILRIIICISLCIVLADQVASSVFKPLVARWRPTHAPNIMYMVDIVRGYRGGNYGFFSSHAANTMAVATFVTLLMRRKTLSYWLGSWVLLNCWTRIYLGVHYAGDLFTGLVWGGIVGVGIYKLFMFWSMKVAQTQRKAQYARLNTEKPHFTTSNYTLHQSHLLIAALLTTYLYIAFKALFFAE